MIKKEKSNTIELRNYYSYKKINNSNNNSNNNKKIIIKIMEKILQELIKIKILKDKMLNNKIIRIFYLQKFSILL